MALSSRPLRFKVAPRNRVKSFFIWKSIWLNLPFNLSETSDSEFYRFPLAPIHSLLCQWHLHVRIHSLCALETIQAKNTKTSFHLIYEFNCQQREQNKCCFRLGARWWFACHLNKTLSELILNNDNDDCAYGPAEPAISLLRGHC